MKRTITKIEFVLENCDAIIFNKEDIDIMYITDVTKYIYMETIRR